MRQEVLDEQRSIRPLIGIGHSANEPVIVAAGVEHQALPHFVSERIKHPHVRREGLDLHLTLPVTLDEAYVGATIDVPTFEGTVALKIPPRSQNHAKLRLRGKGVPKKDTRGDLIVELDVRMPDQADEALAEALRAAAKLYTKPVREEVRL